MKNKKCNHDFQLALQEKVLIPDPSNTALKSSFNEKTKIVVFCKKCALVKSSVA